MRKIWVLICVVLLAGAQSVAAQSGNAHPGYFPIEELGIFGEGDLEVNVDLSGAMLQVAAGAMENRDESLVDLFSKLERVRSGWDKILTVEEEDEQVYLYSLEQGEAIAGLTVLVNDGGDEVVLVNIAGSIDPRTLGRLLSNVGDFELDELMAAIDQ
jgi:hypothetical protein